MFLGGAFCTYIYIVSLPEMYARMTPVGQTRGGVPVYTFNYPKKEVTSSSSEGEDPLPANGESAFSLPPPHRLSRFPPGNQSANGLLVTGTDK